MGAAESKLLKRKGSGPGQAPKATPSEKAVPMEARPFHTACGCKAGVTASKAIVKRESENRAGVQHRDHAFVQVGQPRTWGSWRLGRRAHSSWAAACIRPRGRQ
jgi:hypothetical protein